MYKEKLRNNMWVLERTSLPDKYGGIVRSPLHYGDTVEFTLIRGIEGEMTVNGKPYELEYENVFFIPPGHLHSSVFRKGGNKDGDMISAFHISLEPLSKYINIKNILLADNRPLSALPTRLDGFDTILGIISEIASDTLPFSSRISRLIDLFEAVSKGKRNVEPISKYYRSAIDIVDYVEEHYFERLTLDDAASHFGYSKNYFCNRVKSATGVTFNDFLNSVRIGHACKRLSEGTSIEETAFLCGFTDPSYFIKVFRRYMGMTPKSFSDKNRFN